MAKLWLPAALLVVLNADSVLGATLTSVTPTQVSTTGGTDVTIIGTGLVSTEVPRIGGQPLTNIVFTDRRTEQEFRGLSPALSAGFHDAEIFDPRVSQVVATMRQAVEAAAPPEISSVEPALVSTAGNQDVTIHGRNFLRGDDFSVEGGSLANQLVASGGEARGRIASPLSAGFHDLVLKRGGVVAASLARALEAADPPAVTSVEPSEIPTQGGIPVTVNGRSFRDVTVIQIGSARLLNPQVDARTGTRITGTAPPGTAGPKDVTALDTRGIAVLRNGVTYVAPSPPRVTSIVPSKLSTDEPTPITIQGESFTRDTTVVFFESGDVSTPIVLGAVWGSSSLLRGTAPPHRAGRVDAVARDPVSGLESRLPGAAEYFAPAALVIPGPREIETSLAEGEARFAWSNPVKYQKVIVLDETGRNLQELAGNATSLKVGARGLERVALQFRGVTLEGLDSALSKGVAKKYPCKTPPILLGRWDAGFSADTIEFTLYGKHVPASVARCAAAPMNVATPADGGGGANEEAGGGGSLNGIPQAKGSIGYVLPQSDLAQIEDPNKLTTGFTLEQPSYRIEIDVFMEKLATHFDLELRGRLRHVFPVDGFSDELTFPDVLINQGYAHNCITYFRADKDIGHPGVPNDPDSLPHACKVPLPAGEYLLDIYAVGRKSKLPYYRFIDDPNAEELLIKGAPCPPYPYVRVRDLTGIRTLPDITQVTAQYNPNAVCVCPGLGDCDNPGINVTFQAIGTWIDEQNGDHQVPPNDPSDDNPDFEYCWTIYDHDGGTTKASHASSSLSLCIPDWGCYQIDLVVLDKACAFVKKRSFEVPIVPPNVACANPWYTFLYPTPDPGGVYGILGLNTNPSPGQGNFDGKVPIEFHVLVVPNCYCQGTNPCPAATVDDIDFRLYRGFPDFKALVGASIEVLDLCPNVGVGAKYFHVLIKDLGEIPAQSFLDDHDPESVRLQVHTVMFKDNPVTDPDWQNIGKDPMHLLNYPDALDGGGQGAGALWTGHLVPEDSSFHFVVKSDPDILKESDLGDVEAIDILGLAEIPAAPDNRISSGFVSRFMMQKGLWSPEDGDGVMDGKVLGNQTKGAPIHPKGESAGGSAAGLAAGWRAGDGTGAIAIPLPELPTYEWCDHHVIFENHFSQTLFDSILYVGTIGPIPISVSASIGLGLDFKVESQLAAFAAPFAPVESLVGGSTGQRFVETHFDLCSAVNISVPCQVRADILGGIGSIAVRLVPQAGLDLKSGIDFVETSLEPQLFVEGNFKMDMEAEGCINLVLGEVCTPTITIPVVPNTSLFHLGADFGLAKCKSQQDEPICQGAGGGTGGGVNGSGAKVFQLVIPPVITWSPQFKSRILANVDPDGKSQVKIGTSPNLDAAALIDTKDILDPAAAFVSETAAYVAWTKSFDFEAGVPQPPPGDIGNPLEYLPPRNLLAGQMEVVLSPVILQNGAWKFLGPFRLADEESVPVQDRRADGRASIAPDRPAGEAMVAWVRYESSSFLVLDEFEPKKTLHLPCSEGIGNPNLFNCLPVAGKAYCACESWNYRTNLRSTAIYARRVWPAGGLGPKQKLSLPGINIEPSLALSPSGQVGYCLWVHNSYFDPVTGRPTVNVIDSNRNRQFHYAVYSKATDSWSAPQGLLAKPEDYPGMLEPFVALKGDGLNGLGKGLAAFTALKKSASEKDTGLGGGSRYVYGCHLEDGVFGEPFLIHGKCGTGVTGHWVSVMFDPGELFDSSTDILINPPDWVLMFTGDSPNGPVMGPGAAMVSVLGKGMTEFMPPVSLTDGKSVVTNVAGTLAGGKIHTIYLNSGSAQPGQGGGAGLSQPAYEIIETGLEPDAAITRCKLTDQFPAPGSIVTARVDVENLGFASTAHDKAGKSLLGVEAVFIADDGTERVMGMEAVPEIAPGGKKQVKFQLELPHDPVRLRVALNPNPLDRDLTNNWQECPFGAPKPGDFACVAVVLPGEDARLVARLSWTNPALYDQLLLYRVGTMIAALPGACKSYVDLYSGQGVHAYALRGRMLASKSSRAECAVDVRPPLPPGVRFRRAFVNDDAQDDISDDVTILGFLFTGRPDRLNCAKAADTNDDGRVDLSDAVFHLAYKFLGGLPPHPPYDACGSDPTPDDLSCETPNCP